MDGRAKLWTINPPHPQAEELASRLRVSTLLAQALLIRGMTEIDDCQAFLSPSLKSLCPPLTLPGASAASQRIARAIRDQEKIVIYGDYDVDGITAAAILWHAIRLLGGQVGYYIPHRIEEGYGLNSEAVAQIIDDGAKLIVTVDCGVTAIEPAKVAREQRVDLIITDHHQFHPEQLPDCFAIVHPRLKLDGQTEEYPNPNLCGAGVALKLAWAVALAHSQTPRVSEDFKKFLIEATSLAALGTIADVVPLLGENRVLAHFGLSGLRSSTLPGVRALIASASLTGKNLDSYHVGFCLAPRLNACGRMGHAELALKMLTEATESEALEIASFLETQNRQRQNLERQILEQALSQLEQSPLTDQDRAVVLASDKWHPGVIGIVAARLVDRLCRPAVLISLSNGQGQGSARSVPGFHLANAFNACSQHLLSHGGHEMAAGLKIQTESFDAFRAAFCNYARDHVQLEMMRPELKLESLADLAQMNEATVTDLWRLGPFGHGNRRPLFCFRDVQLAAEPRIVGKTGGHLQLWVKKGDKRLKCIAFNRAWMKDRLTAGTRIELAAEPSINDFNGSRSVELDVKDLKFSEG
jgi:single-stranded-DNA-specific exonuclease